MGYYYVAGRFNFSVACLIMQFTCFICRKFREAELQSAVISQQRIVRPHCTSRITVLEKSISCTRATPSLPRAFNIPLHSVPQVPSSLLTLPEGNNIMIGKGRFGTCSKMVFKDMYAVCVKIIADGLPLSSIMAEANILCLLNDGEHTPHCFGVCLEKRAIVTSYVSVSNKPQTLHAYLQDCNGSLASALDFLLQIGQGMQFVHRKDILHNDLKCNNVILGHTVSNLLKIYIIDFGKACMVCNAKHYKLSAAEVEVYKKEHTQIAPDLRDGLVSQCTATDVYAFGRIMKKIISSMHIHHENLKKVTKQTLAYHSHERVSLSNIVEEITKLLVQS